MLTVNFIGCGRLGRTIAKLFHINHIAEIKGVINSTLESSLDAVAFIGHGTAVKTLSELPTVDVTFITTSDDRIEEICQQLVSLNLLKPSSIVVHCSGALSSDILLAAKTAKCSIASVHPIRSFANPKEIVNTFQGTFCSLEGDEETKLIMARLFEAIGGIMLVIHKENKKRYHAATVIANNYLVTLHYHAVQNFIQSGIEEPAANNLVSTLMSDAFNNLKTLPHSKTLTGPIQRGDIKTIKGHIESFEDDTVSKNIYSSLGRGTLPLTAHSPNILDQFINIFNDSIHKESFVIK
ncbi:MAG: DUF2520 domain-containing protein [Gammaproteobacteria bacterium]